MVLERGQTTPITGASSGLGEAFARTLAARGLHVILVARSAAPLAALEAERAAQRGVRAEAIVADLARPGAARELAAEVARRGLAVDLLINNAGFGTYGPFEALPAERDHAQVSVNVAAPVALAHAFLPDMVARGRGAVINVASLGGFGPAPYMAVYGASKAFMRSFSEALRAEYRGRGVRVLALCPGPMATRFFAVVGATEPAVGAHADPAWVVAAALRALEHGRGSVVPGWRNALLAQASGRFLPRTLVARLTARILRPRAPLVGTGAAPAPHGA